jgi:hypothetical protein
MIEIHNVLWDNRDNFSRFIHYSYNIFSVIYRFLFLRFLFNSIKNMSEYVILVSIVKSVSQF